jgi:hypothetical protein
MTESGYGRDPQPGPPPEDVWQQGVGAAPGPAPAGWPQYSDVSTGQGVSPYPGLPARLPRPRKATTVSVLLIVFGALGVLLGLLLLALISHDKNNGETVSGALYLAAYLQLVLSAAEVVCGILLLQGREAARIVAIVLCGLNIVGGLISLFSGGGTGIVGIGLNILMVRLLFNSDVAEWCRQA